MIDSPSRKQSFTQPTYAGHRWRVRIDTGEIIREETATEEPQTVTISP